MQYSNVKNVWAFSKPKEAALYYDKALIVFNDLWDGGGKTFLENMVAHEVHDLLAKVDIEDKDTQVYSVPAPNITLIGPKFEQTLLGSTSYVLEQSGIDPDILNLGDEALGDDLANYRRQIERITRIRIAIKVGIIEPSDVLLPDFFYTSDNAGDCTSFLLTKLRVIDTKNLSWDHLIDIRGDAEAIAKLRNLKLFLYKNFHGEEPSFIEDELERHIEDYELTAKQLGAEMIDGSLGMLFEKDVAAAATASLAAALVGQLQLAAAATLPIFLKMGKAAIEVRKARRKLDKISHSNAVAFLHDVRNTQS